MLTKQIYHSQCCFNFSNFCFYKAYLAAKTEQELTLNYTSKHNNNNINISITAGQPERGNSRKSVRNNNFGATALCKVLLRMGISSLEIFYNMYIYICECVCVCVHLRLVKAPNCNLPQNKIVLKCLKLNSTLVPSTGLSEK